MDLNDALGFNLNAEPRLALVSVVLECDTRKVKFQQEVEDVDAPTSLHLSTVERTAHAKQPGNTPDGRVVYNFYYWFEPEEQYQLAYYELMEADWDVVHDTADDSFFSQEGDVE